jgi:micrococcal nuclease
VVGGNSLVSHKTKIRLFGVDAPEPNHHQGKSAKWALHALCTGHLVRAKIIENDNHGRTVARCSRPDGRDLSAEMVSLGMAIDWPKFSKGVYRALKVPEAHKKMWLTDARQKRPV